MKLNKACIFTPLVSWSSLEKKHHRPGAPRTTRVLSEQVSLGFHFTLLHLTCSRTVTPWTLGWFLSSPLQLSPVHWFVCPRRFLTVSASVLLRSRVTVCCTCDDAVHSVRLTLCPAIHVLGVGLGVGVQVWGKCAPCSRGACTRNTLSCQGIRASRDLAADAFRLTLLFYFLM